MKLYDQVFAPNPRRVRIFMAEKGIECERVQVNIVEAENLDEEFLSISPRGLLPCLVLDDGTVIDESLAICRYFEEIQPDPPLMGTTALERAQIAARERHMEFDGLRHAAEAFRNAYPKFSERGLGGSVGNVPAIAELVPRSRRLLSKFYLQLESHLAGHGFVHNDFFTVADITALCTVDFASVAGRVPLPETCANLWRWHREVSARPSAAA